MAKFRDNLFIIQEGTNTQIKRFGVHETCTEVCRRVEVWRTVSLQTFFSEPQLVKTLKKEQKKSKILGNLLDKKVEIMEDQGCPKVQNLVHKEMWFCSTHPFRQETTLHCAEHLDIAPDKVVNFLYCEKLCQFLRN